MKNFSPDSILFPPIEPYASGMLEVDEIHTLYWEQSGNPNGEPVLFLHGGPGSGTNPNQRRFFDPAHYRIVLFDQRGAGRSRPLGEHRNNTTQLLIEDIERIRTLLGIERWLVFGGSWGSTLALAYGQAHAERCLGFVLRGIFFCGKQEVDWFLNGMRWFFPDAHDRLTADIPEEERGDLLQAYAKRLFSGDPAIYRPASRTWSEYEGSTLFLIPDASSVAQFGADQVSLGLARMEVHYMLHQAFMEEDQLIRDVERIRHLPCVIVQGRYDMVCPPRTAFRLHSAWPEARFHLVPDAGHAAFEPGTLKALVEATEQFRRKRAFD
jgi:proline iminopeptidase